MKNDTEHGAKPRAKPVAQKGSTDEKVFGVTTDGKAFEASKAHNQSYLEISRPYIHDMYQLLGVNSGCGLMLADGQGLILEAFGDPDALKIAAGFNLLKGANMQGSSLGSRAMGATIKEGRPVQVTGKESQARAVSRLTCSAAPILDANDKLVGIICLTAEIEKYQPFMLGLVGSIAKSIESRIHNSYIQSQLYKAQQYAFSIMNRLSFGLLAINLEGDIQWVNDTACRALDRRRTRLINRGIEQICPDWHRFKRLIDNGDLVQDEECQLATRTAEEKFIINSYSINNEQDEKIGYAITLRPFRNMLPLLNKYSLPQIRFTFEKIIYRGKKMHQLVEYAKSIADTPSTVLLTGESGTGKEVFAQAIHNASGRKEQPFVAINCGAISASLIESELFGYEEGAFTGAAKGGKPGKFEMADKGTLFLDEIGEMPPDMQVKLLRVLQDRIITRVGGGKPLKVDVRLITATNKNLDEEVKSGKFREDLYYRISVIPLHLPPLRERKMDILPLFKYFLKRKATRLDRPIPHVGQQLVQEIMGHSWPGNIRELENLAEKAVILQGNQAMLFPASKPAKGNVDQEGALILPNDRDQLPTFEVLERSIIERYLEHFDGNVMRTAKTLGMGRNTLYQKIQKYQLRAK